MQKQDGKQDTEPSDDIVKNRQEQSRVLMRFQENHSSTREKRTFLSLSLEIPFGSAIRNSCAKVRGTIRRRRARLFRVIVRARVALSAAYWRGMSRGLRRLLRDGNAMSRSLVPVHTCTGSNALPPSPLPPSPPPRGR